MAEKNTKYTRQTGRLKDGLTIVGSPLEEVEAYVLSELVATFDRFTERLADSELQEEQTEIVNAMASIGKVVILNKLSNAIEKLTRVIPDGTEIASSLDSIAEALESQEEP